MKSINHTNVKHTVYFVPSQKPNNTLSWLISASYIYSDIGLVCGLRFLASYIPLSDEDLFD